MTSEDIASIISMISIFAVVLTVAIIVMAALL